jgi:hypothetical protein
MKVCAAAWLARSERAIAKERAIVTEFLSGRVKKGCGQKLWQWATRTMNILMIKWYEVVV